MSVVLITGCSGGIGLQTALGFARRGDVIYASVRSLERATELTERAGAEGLAVEVVQLDVSEDASMRGAVAGI